MVGQNVPPLYRGARSHTSLLCNYHLPFLRCGILFRSMIEKGRPETIDVARAFSSEPRGATAGSPINASCNIHREENLRFRPYYRLRYGKICVQNIIKQYGKLYVLYMRRFWLCVGFDIIMERKAKERLPSSLGRWSEARSSRPAEGERASECAWERDGERKK